MNVCSCKCRCECTVFAIIASVIAGVVAAFLNFSLTIAIPQFVLWIFFGVALIFLAAALLAAPFVDKKESDGCLCGVVSALIAGVLGTVLISLVLVLADIAAGLLASVLTGLLFGFFTLTVTSVACLIKSIFNCQF